MKLFSRNKKKFEKYLVNQTQWFARKIVLVEFGIKVSIAISKQPNGLVFWICIGTSTFDIGYKLFENLSTLIVLWWDRPRFTILRGFNKFSNFGKVS